MCKTMLEVVFWPHYHFLEIWFFDLEEKIVFTPPYQLLYKNKVTTQTIVLSINSNESSDLLYYKE